MKRLVLALALALVAGGTALWAAQDQGGLPEPSAEHELLHKSIGTWDASIEMMGATSKGAMVVERGPGGFSVLTHFTGDFGGMPFEGRGIDAYDVHKKQYVSMWVDLWSASPMVSQGTWDSATKTMTMRADGVDMNGAPQKQKLVTTWKSDDEMDFVMWVPGADGKESVAMTIRYQRRK